MIRNPLFLAAATILVSCSALHAQAVAASRPYELDDKALDVAIAGLDDPAARYASLRKIVLYYWSYPHSSPSVMMSYGSAETDDRIRRAGGAISKGTDISTVTQALADPERKMQWWGLWTAGGVLEKARGPDPRTDIIGADNLALLASVRKFCTVEDAGLREQAQSALSWIHSEHEFLQKILEEETSAENIMRLLTANGLNADYVPKMNTHLLRLLNSKDAKVRAGAFSFISWNSNMAEMFHCTFSAQVRNKVLELNAQSTDRAASAGAIGALYESDPAKLLARFKEMTADKDPAVRGQTALALYSHDKTPELHALLLTMLNDSDDLARLIAIEADGTQKHAPEMRALANSKNAEVAQVASTVVKAWDAASTKP